MEKQDYEKFVEILTITAELYDKKLSIPMIQMYFLQLKEFTIDQVKSALGQRYKYMPKPFDIAESIQGNDDDLKNITALNQASLVLETLSSAGADMDPQFKDATTRYLMASVWPYRSWGKNLKESEVKWWRKEFVQAYKDFSGAPEQKQLSHQESVKILGIIEDHG